MLAVVENVSECLSAQANALRDAGVSKAWASVKSDGKPYKFWYEGRRLRSRRVSASEMAEINAAHSRYLCLKWVNTIQGVVATGPAMQVKA